MSAKLFYLGRYKVIQARSYYILLIFLYKTQGAIINTAQALYIYHVTLPIIFTLLQF